MKKIITILLTVVFITACGTSNKENKAEGNKYVEEVVAAYKQATMEIRNVKSEEEAKGVALKLQDAANRAKGTYKTDYEELNRLKNNDVERYNRLGMQITAAAGEFNKASVEKKRELNISKEEEKTENAYVDAFIAVLAECEKNVASAKSEDEVKAVLDAVNVELKRLDEVYAADKARYEAMINVNPDEAKRIGSKMENAYTSLTHTVEEKSIQLSH